MPFTPKFVDMVRNVTSSTGTGAVSLGSAVSGFTSLADAVAVGEQFYYCIQGVDKPAEREVGRGTMQAGATIARQPISGALVNFTTGIKTIALIAAAEWFAKIDAGGTGGAGSVVASLVDLAALPTANGAAALLTAKGREGLFVFETSNLSAKVTADPRKAITVAPAAAPSGTSGAWVRKYDGAINVRWFGAVADFVTDDLPAFDAALALIKTTALSGGVATLRVPGGRYYCSTTLNIHVPVYVVGDGSGQGNGGTLIRFGKNCNGIVVNKGNTHGDGVGSQGDASGSVIQGMQLYGGNANVDGSGNVTSFAAGDSPTGHGVRIRGTFVTCIDVFAAVFGGSGFHVVTNSGAGGYTEGNANTFVFERCQSIYNRGYGYEISGLDANAGTVNTCSAISNGAGGFIEYSFLGNSYIQCHARDNGKSDPTGGNGPVGVCTYGGNAYYMVAGQDVLASTTVPGTNAAVWVQYYGGGASKAWVTGLSWINPSPYGTNPANVNGRNVFTGCYAESGQAPCQATYPSLFIGGLLDEVTVVGSATWLRGTSGGGISCGEFVTRGTGVNANKFTQFGGQNGQTIFAHQGDGVGNVHFRRRDDFFGKKAIDLQLDNSAEIFNIGLEAPHIWGYGSFTIGRLLVGAGTVSSAIRIGCANDPMVDMAGQKVPKGSIFYKLNPVLGDPEGWICTTGGTVGSGALFDDLGPLGAKEATNSELWAGASANRFVSPKRLFEAAAPVVLTDGATINIDGSSGVNFNVTLGGNRTLANPTNMKPGQSGRIRIKQDATGSRTIAFGTNWLFAGGDPPLSTTANAIDVVAYFVNSPTEIEATIAKALS